jgi:hypothetical protein
MSASYAGRETISLKGSTDQRVLPGTPTRFTGTPRWGAMMLERLHVGSYPSGSDLNDWIVNEIEIDGVSQLKVKDLAGVLFHTDGVVVKTKHAGSSLVFHGLLIEIGGEVAVTVSYVGPNPEGAEFCGLIVGGPAPQRPTQLAFASKDPIRRETISIALDIPMRIQRLEIDTGWEGADWVIDDVRVDGKTQYLQDGPLPGDLFTTQAIDSFVSWQEGTLIEIDVHHIGSEPAGERFVGRLVFDERRDISKSPPPDVRATIQYRKFRDPSEEAAVHCDWRPPHLLRSKA